MSTVVDRAFELPAPTTVVERLEEALAALTAIGAYAELRRREPDADEALGTIANYARRELDRLASESMPTRREETHGSHRY